MSDVRMDLERSLDRLGAELCTVAVREAAEKGELPLALWNAAVDLGLDKLALSEENGGFGFSLSDALFALRVLARHAMPLPLADHFIACRLLQRANIEVPDGPLTLALGSYALTEASVDGSASRVPSADHCTQAVVVSAERIGLVSLEGARSTRERNLASESRLQLEFKSAPLIAAASLKNADDMALCEAALVRSVQMVGAMEGAMSMTIQYATERVQFGRAIGKFQAVQQMIAVMAGEVAASSAASDYAIYREAQAHDPAAVAVAKARVSEAAGKVAESAHQTLGAMGITREHGLHYRTRRLWAWREEFGNEVYWQTRLGQAVCAQGADSVWPMLSEFPSAIST